MSPVEPYRSLNWLAGPLVLIQIGMFEVLSMLTPNWHLLEATAEPQHVVQSLGTWNSGLKLLVGMGFQSKAPHHQYPCLSWYISGAAPNRWPSQAMPCPLSWVPGF